MIAGVHIRVLCTRLDPATPATVQDAGVASITFCLNVRMGSGYDTPVQARIRDQKFAIALTEGPMNRFRDKLNSERVLGVDLAEAFDEHLRW